MKNKKYWLITSAITLLPILLGIALWDRLPDRIPTHFGIDGAADGWGGKGFAVFGIPAMWLIFHLITWGVTRLDKQNRGHNEKVLNLVGLTFPVMSIAFSVLLYTRALEIELSFSALLFPLLGLLFIVMGNWMPKIKQNSTLGIKIKWTLYSEENWNKTHRFAGFVWVIGGILFCLMGFVPEKTLLFLLPLQILLLAVVPTVYSWNLARKQRAAGTYTESEVNRELKKHPVILAVTMLLVTVILVGVGFLMFTGDIDYTLTDTALTIEADYHDDSVVPYEQIDAIEFRETAPEGIRDWGFASARLMLGRFDNEEFGIHIRYSYVGTDAQIILDCGEDVLILNAESEDATRALYEELLEKIS